MKLHLGCGRHYLPGYVNVDAVHRDGWPKPDVISPIHPDVKLMYANASEILAVHLFEHFYLWEARELLRQWFGMLRPGGKLILELPDIAKCASNLAAGADWSMSMFGLYGDPQTCDPLMNHKWGWTPQTLSVEMRAIGFDKIRVETPQWHPKGRYNRDMRLVGERV